MNDTTHANATAKTALGCLNGLAAEPPWAPVIGVSTPFRNSSGAGVAGGGREGATGLSPRRGGAVFVTRHGGERGERRERGRQGGAVLGGELGEDQGEPVGTVGAAPGE